MAVGHGHERFALDAVGLDVHTGVEVARAQFAEVGRVEARRLADREDIVIGMEPLGGCLRTGRGQENRYQKSSHVSVSLTSAEAASITVS